jgi:hypothetical protein
VEQELVREFKRAHHNYSTHTPHPDAMVEWLSLMQHHGAPTRFLDFTYSVHVAAYFAIEAAEGDSAVWAINGRWALNQSVALLRAAGKEKKLVEALKDRFMEDSEHAMNELFFERRGVRFATPMNPFRLNERLRIQKGVFLAPGRVDAPFVANLAALPGYQKPGNVLRIVIPKRLVGPGLVQLFRMNVTRTSLFPGLDGYSRALGVYHPIFNPNDMIWAAIKF